MNNVKSQPTLYVLVGAPASGKSTWVKQEIGKIGNCAYISTDHFVDEYAAAQGKTYNEVFKEYMPTAIHKMADAVIAARAAGQNIIWDQTSMTVAARRKKFNMLPKYRAIAVVFPTPAPDEHARRLASRPGKNIPAEVVSSMINSFEMPTAAEGFDEVWYQV